MTRPIHQRVPQYNVIDCKRHVGVNEGMIDKQKTDNATIQKSIAVKQGHYTIDV